MTFRKNYVFTGLALFLFISWSGGLIWRYHSGQFVSPLYIFVAAAAGFLFFRLALVPFAIFKERILVLNPGLFVSRFISYIDIAGINRKDDTNICINLKNGKTVIFKEMFMNKKDREKFAQEITKHIVN